MSLLLEIIFYTVVIGGSWVSFLTTIYTLFLKRRLQLRRLAKEHH